MVREVTNLAVLNNANCRVPKVLESNVDRFEVPGVALYFVMEYVAGITLAKHIKDGGALPLKESSLIVRKLAATVALAQKEEILHRDLKPDNIVIRSNQGGVGDDIDVVIVDYGLSFNSRLDGELTRVSETLDNSFLSLPERRVPGGNRRDFRSDITGLSGILYFCLTGHHPVDLVGPDNRAPHKRVGHSIKEKLGGSVGTSVLESFFDRGFSPNLESRFQTIDEFNSRLDEVLDPMVRAVREDPVAAARRAGNALLEGDKKSKIAAFNITGGGLRNPLNACFNKFEGKLDPFRIDQNNGIPADFKVISGYDSVDVDFVTTISTHGHQMRMMVGYQICCQGFQCAVFRGLVKLEAKQYQIVQPWQPIFRYDGREKPDFSIVGADFEATITEGIQALEAAILSLDQG